VKLGGRCRLATGHLHRAPLQDPTLTCTMSPSGDLVAGAHRLTRMQCYVKLAPGDKDQLEV